MKIEGRYNNYDRYMPNRPVHSSEIKDELIKISSASSVNLSETTQKIRKEVAQNDLSRNDEKIKALKAAIKDGTYQISAKEIAASMMKAMTE